MNRLIETSLHLASSYELEYIRVDDYITELLREESEITPFLRILWERIDNKLDDMGQVSWKYAIEEFHGQIYISNLQWYWLCRLGEGWFGDSRVSNAEFLRKSCGILSEIKSSYEEQEKQRMKMLLPVGMLAGCIVVILLI